MMVCYDGDDDLMSMRIFISSSSSIIVFTENPRIEKRTNRFEDFLT